MKLLIILQITLFALLTLAQGKHVSVANRPTDLDIDLIFEQQPYSKKLFNSRTIVEYINAIDEAHPGSPILPSKTYFIAIPPLSNISLRLTEQKYNFINNVEVALNPEVKLSNDSILDYRDSKLDLSNFIYENWLDKWN